MSLRLLIDECLSPDLVDLAIRAGMLSPPAFAIGDSSPPKTGL
jgi:hypothetical protein